ncbi:MAG: hypothetical protein UZ15_CFX003000882 [Chloroflexi bacterium OLB15]|nr:MAG: hypothetical protein UZ15_CFX003000882 [Chloroflexi bacterium OLB15]
MKLEIHAPQTAAASQPIPVRVVLLNDSYEPVAVSRNNLIGPNPQGQGMILPNVEPTFGQPEEPLTLQPFTLYGRQREIGPFAGGDVVVTAEYQSDQGKLTQQVTIRVK